MSTEFDLFEALTALDKKDYGYYSRLTEEQKRKFVPFMLVQWLSAVKGNSELQQYYLSSTDYHANKYLFNENVQKHPELVWMMLCAASPGMGKQFHQWIPNISQSVSKLKTSPKLKDISDYYAKVYPNISKSDIKEVATAFMEEHKIKKYLAGIYPTLKLEDIETLSKFVTQDDIKEYERQLGNT